MILFQIAMDLFLATWKLRKAVKIEFMRKYPFMSFGGQKGYESNSTSQYDDQAVRYMMATLVPLFLGYSLRSLFYGKHRGWWSYFVGTMAGGVYTFGFIMMTPQLYINYKLQSVEHLPWRALTYKAMNTFVDDVAALLIDMPMMHRLSCFRDDVIFFVYLYQRWAYKTDKTRPTMYGEAPADFVPGETRPVMNASGTLSSETVATDAAAAKAGSDTMSPQAASATEAGAPEATTDAAPPGGESQGCHDRLPTDARASDPEPTLAAT